MNRAERRARTARIVKRRCVAAKRTGMPMKPGEFKKRPPVCYCPMCRLARKPGSKPKDALNAAFDGAGQDSE